MDEAEDGLAVVALGGNVVDAQGGPAERLEAALARFSDHGLHVVKRSGWWTSQAWPDPRDPPFVNGVALVRTALPPAAVLAALHAIERAFGRRRGARNAARTLDLDLVAHGDRVLESAELVLPHPRAAERRFVMGPLAEIAPGWRHPVTARTADDLAASADVGRDARPLAAPSRCNTGAEPVSCVIKPH